MNELVRLRTRPSRDGKTFTYRLEYTDEDGKRRRISLGHADKRKAERQRAQKERELRMGIVGPVSMRLSDFLEDSLRRSRGQVRESTLTQRSIAMRHFIKVIGNIDYLQVRHEHGEQFIQARLDAGRSPATVHKELRGIRRVFQLAKERRQIEENPFLLIHKPRVPRKAINIYSDEQCAQLIKSAGELQRKERLDWRLLIIMALYTGLRRGEWLNATWSDVNFDRQTIVVAPKRSTDKTWEWHIKDTERRTLPLTDEISAMLAEHRSRQPQGYPYVFVPPSRYDHIQKRRRQGNWTVQDGTCPVNNFTRQWQVILAHAGIELGEFHDLRCTCLTRWFENGLSEYDVMKLAGHSDFGTTHRFYLAVRRDLLDRARRASEATMNRDFGTHLARTLISEKNEEGRQSQVVENPRVTNYPRCDSNAQPLAPEANALSN